MRFIIVFLCLFMVSSACIAAEDMDVKDYEIQEIKTVVEIIKDISDYVGSQTLKYGFGNQFVIEHIANEILIKKYEFRKDEIYCAIICDPSDFKPTSIIVYFEMVFGDYNFEFTNFNVEEPKNEKIGSKNI